MQHINIRHKQEITTHFVEE